jgi:HEAT repeat protein
MNRIHRIRTLAPAAALLLFSISSSQAQRVTICPDSSGSLQARWQWAETASQGSGRPSWTGYSIAKMMEPNCFVGSFSSDSRRNRPALTEQVYGRRVFNTDDPEDGRGEYRGNGSKGPKVRKEIGILIHHGPSGKIDDVTVSNMSLHVDLRDDPVFWLGGAEDKESIALLTSLYDQAPGAESRKKIVTASAFHEASGPAFPFLRRVLTGNDETSVREDAAFWLGETGTPEALKLLVETATGDRSAGVREKAVFGISQMELDGAIDALISLAREGKDTEVRKKALFWLGQKASDKAVATLEKVASEDEDTKIQKEALFALTQLPGKSGVEPLIKIAKTHKNPRVRKEAIFWLSQSEDDRAFDALVEIVKK